MALAPIVLALLVIVGFAASAWKYGVTHQMSGVLSSCGGIIVGMLCFTKTPKLIESWSGLSLSNMLIVVLSFVIGLIAFFILKLIFHAVLTAIFNADSPLHHLSAGFGGALASLIPSLVLLAVLATGIRMTGTLMELRNLQHVTRAETYFSKNTYPKWPFLTRCRDEIEKIPLLARTFDMADPISKREVRNLTALLIASKNQEFVAHFQTTSKTSSIVDSEAFQEAGDDEDVRKINDANNRPGLLMNSVIQNQARSTSIRSELRDLDIIEVIDSYLLSPGKLEAATARGKSSILLPTKPAAETR